MKRKDGREKWQTGTEDIGTAAWGCPSRRAPRVPPDLRFCRPFVPSGSDSCFVRVPVISAHFHIRLLILVPDALICTLPCKVTQLNSYSYHFCTALRICEDLFVLRPKQIAVNHARISGGRGLASMHGCRNAGD